MKLAAGYTFSDVDGQAGNIVLAQKLHDLIEKATLTEKVSQNDLDDGLKTLIGIDGEGNIAIRVDQLSDELKAELGIVEGETALSRTHLSQDLQDLLFIEYDEDTETYMMKIPASALPEFTLEDLGVIAGKGLEFDGGGLLQLAGWTILETPVTVVTNISNVTDQDIPFDLSAEASIPDDSFQLLFEIQATHCLVTLEDSYYDGQLFHALGEDAQTQKIWAEVQDLVTLLQRTQLNLRYEEVQVPHGTGSLDHIKIIGYRY